MARRRPVAAPVREARGDVPEELTRCHVEDWMGPGDVPDAYWSDQPGFWYLIAAWRRWKRARLEWLPAHGVPRERHGETIPSRRPSFRDWSSFAPTVGLDPETGDWARRGGGPSRR